MALLQSLRGTTDLLAGELARWLAVEHAAKTLAARYGYHEIRTPIIEDAALFLRSIGETTDIVQKEMFKFTKGESEIVLRPEGTAPVVRAYLEHHLHKTQGFAKLFYLGAMFRAERPQAGRQRQFHQFGIEAIGSYSAWVDVEVIAFTIEALRACGVTPRSLWLSTMGCRDDQANTAERIRQALQPHRSTLCQDCQARFDRNVYRVLDCKQPDCRRILSEFAPMLGGRKGYPPTVSHLCDACAAHFDTVREGLRRADIAFDDAQVFARGLDYYTRTVFEIKASGLGAQDTVAAGGRYDHLVEELGGPPTGAVGVAAGIERILISAGSAAAAASSEAPRAGLYLAIAQPALMGEAFRLVQQLRGRGVMTLTDYEGRSLKAQLREADKLGCRWVVVIGEQELRERRVTLKDLSQGQPQSLTMDELLTWASGQTSQKTA